jgi:hypothetical protein
VVEQPAPVKKIDAQVLRQLGLDLKRLFERYAQDRQLQEQKFLRNLRQYLGIYDPEVERQLPVNGSRAYPRLTRVKCVSMLSRVMNLMFPGNEKNWELGASPSAEMNPADVKQAVLQLMQEMGQQANGQQPQLTQGAGAGGSQPPRRSARSLSRS